MTTKAGSMPTWTDSVIWWQVFPLGFTDAEKSALPADAPVAHRLPQLIEWLDYLIELGCNGLALNPIFASETHGYDIVDHFAVDSRLGDDADIDALIAACHQRGVRVLFDGVFNHVGGRSPGSPMSWSSGRSRPGRSGSTSTGMPTGTTVSATRASKVTADSLR